MYKKGDTPPRYAQGKGITLARAQPTIPWDLYGVTQHPTPEAMHRDTQLELIGPIWSGPGRDSSDPRNGSSLPGISAAPSPGLQNQLKIAGCKKKKLDEQQRLLLIPDTWTSSAGQWWIGQHYLYRVKMNRNRKKLLINKRFSPTKLGSENPFICQKKIPACWRKFFPSPGQRHTGNHFHLFSMEFSATDLVWRELKGINTSNS